MEFKSIIMDIDMIKRTITRISHEIVEKNYDISEIVLIGIKRRGVPIAKRIVENIYNYHKIQIPFGELDATKCRDDLDLKKITKLTDESNINFDINNKTVVLVDDVLYTGRTIRAAIDSIFKLGRPRKIELAILIDRGHRELPIRPDFIGKNIPTSKNEIVSVKLNEIDNEENVSIYLLNNKGGRYEN